jgi:hypothetical protein
LLKNSLQEPANRDDLMAEFSCPAAGLPVMRGVESISGPFFKSELAHTLLFVETEMGTALKHPKKRHERPALRRRGWVLLMATNPPRAIWQRFSDASRFADSSATLSFYSNFFQTDKHLPFKNLGLKR